MVPQRCRTRVRRSPWPSGSMTCRVRRRGPSADQLDRHRADELRRLRGRLRHADLVHQRVELPTAPGRTARIGLDDAGRDGPGGEQQELPFLGFEGCLDHDALLGPSEACGQSRCHCEPSAAVPVGLPSAATTGGAVPPAGDRRRGDVSDVTDDVTGQGTGEAAFAEDGPYLEGVRVLDFTQYLAGPSVHPPAGRAGRRRDQGRDAALTATPPGPDSPRAQRPRRRLHPAEPGQAEPVRRPASARGRRAGQGAGAPRRRAWWRTTATASWPAGASTTTCCRPSTPG